MRGGMILDVDLFLLVFCLGRKHHDQLFVPGAIKTAKFLGILSRVQTLGLLSWCFPKLGTVLPAKQDPETATISRCIPVQSMDTCGRAQAAIWVTGKNGSAVVGM